MAIDWWAGAAGVLLGTVIGGCIPLFWSWLTRRTERRGEIVAMTVEMYHARINMNAFLIGDVLAPLYHLPLTMFERALPKLIGEGLLDDNQISALVEYVMRAEELNRGLDRAGNAAAIGDLLNLKAEYNRNGAKVGHILDEKLERLGGVTLFEAAESALYRLSGRPASRRALPIQP